MKVSVGQIYVEPGVRFPFSHLMQLWLGGELSALAVPRPAFVARYGPDYNVVIRISARRLCGENVIKGPTVFKKTKDVEYTLFLPFDTIVRGGDMCGMAMTFILSGIQEIFERAEISAEGLKDRKQALSEHVCSEPTMVSGPWPPVP